MMLLKRYDIDSLDNRDEELVGKLCRALRWPLTRYFRAEVRGLDRIPQGAGLYVANHSGSLMTPDSFVFCVELYHRRGPDFMPYGLGHEVAISLPLVHQVIVPLGAVRASHDNAMRLFERGRKVIVYPGGDVDNLRPSRQRYRVIFDGRTGYVRLALRAGVPIIPVVCAGGHDTLRIIDDGRWLASALGLDRSPFRTHVWPLALSIPWGLTLYPPLVYIPLPSRMLFEVLPPITFPRSGPEAARDEPYVQACAEQVHRAMEEMLQRLGAERDGE